MSKRFDLITQQLLGKDLNDCSAEELQQIADQYPFFAPAQFALLRKLKQTESPDYKTQVQKAILYYHDPFAFDYFMNAEKYEVAFDLMPEVQEPLQILATPTNEEIINDEINNTEQVEAQDDIPNEIAVVEDTEPVEETIEPEAATEYEDELSHEEVHEPLPVDNAAINEDVALTEPETAGTDHTNHQPENSLLQQPTEDEQIAEEIIEAEPEPSEPEARVDTEPQIPKLVIPEPKAEDNALAFEPYHTVDYFASQGIKLSQEEATKDRFGKQLKSFTEWLKTMKKLPVVEQQQPADITSDKKVESMAAHSIEQAEVVTESMAEVWAKQGNREKALEIYQQLSLLNPSKKAYFAAKIDSLK